jgi:hypothetical protein
MPPPPPPPPMTAAEIVAEKMASVQSLPKKGKSGLKSINLQSANEFIGNAVDIEVPGKTFLRIWDDKTRRDFKARKANFVKMALSIYEDAEIGEGPSEGALQLLKKHYVSAVFMDATKDSTGSVTAPEDFAKYIRPIVLAEDQSSLPQETYSIMITHYFSVVANAKQEFNAAEQESAKLFASLLMAQMQKSYPTSNSDNLLNNAGLDAKKKEELKTLMAYLQNPDKSDVSTEIGSTDGLASDVHAINAGGGTCYGIAMERERLFYDESPIAGNVTVIQEKITKKLNKGAGIRFRELERQTEEQEQVAKQPFNSSALTQAVALSLPQEESHSKLAKVFFGGKAGAHIMLIGYDAEQKKYFSWDTLEQGILSQPEFFASQGPLVEALAGKYL